MIKATDVIEKSQRLTEKWLAVGEEHDTNCAINSADVADDFHALGCTCKKGEDA